MLKKLGYPPRKPAEELGECTPGRVRTLIYPGLTILFYEEKPGKFYVGEFEVTSERWRVSGVKIGATAADVHSRFGKSHLDSPETQHEEGAIQYDFANEDEPGWTNFYFRKGRLVRMNAGYTVC